MICWIELMWLRTEKGKSRHVCVGGKISTETWIAFSKESEIGSPFETRWQLSLVWRENRKESVISKIKDNRDWFKMHTIQNRLGRYFISFLIFRKNLHFYLKVLCLTHTKNLKKYSRLLDLTLKWLTHCVHLKAKY